MASKPNILFVTSDQQHFSTLGVINPKIKTPNLDRLANEGVRFDRAYTCNPTCTPARASMITGTYPSQHGAYALGTKLFEDVPVVGDMLQKAGYSTSLIGKPHFQPLTSKPGYESIECQPLFRDLDYWRKFQGPWYGFEHIEIYRGHTAESHVGQHYAAWMEDTGLKNWTDYFAKWPRTDDAWKWDKFTDPDGTWHLPEEYHYTTWNGKRAVAQIERDVAEDKPFFCWASFADPHPAYIVPEPWSKMYNPEDMEPGDLTPGEHDQSPIHFKMAAENASKEEWERFDDKWVHGAHAHHYNREKMKQNMATYYGMTSFMDKEIGRILDCLDRLGVADNTVVVFTTDHGHYLGQHGLSAKAVHHYEDMIRLPWIVRWPGKVPKGRVSQSIQNLVDLAPTFLSIAGAEIPCFMTGVDQTGTWLGGKDAREWSITENHFGHNYFHMRTYVNNRYKITVYRKGNDGELFDLGEDPGELKNLWHDPNAQKIKSQLLHEFMQATISYESDKMPRIAIA